MIKRNLPTCTLFSYSMCLLVISSIFFVSCSGTKKMVKQEGSVNKNAVHVLEIVLLSSEALDPEMSEEEKQEILETITPIETRYLIHDNNMLALVVFDENNKIINHVVFDKMKNLYRNYEVRPLLGGSYNELDPDEEYPPEAMALIEEKLLADAMLKIDTENRKNILGYDTYSISMSSPDFGELQIWTSKDFPKGDSNLLAEFLHFQYMICLEYIIELDGIRAHYGVKEKKVDASFRKYFTLEEGTYVD